VRPRTPKRAVEERVYARLRQRILHDQPWCVAGDRIRMKDPGHQCGNGTHPGRRATQLHHLRKRSSAGSLTNPDNVEPVCGWCNEWIEDHPNQAHALRLVVRPGDDAWERLGARASRAAR
jgi:hypothetical protein